MSNVVKVSGVPTEVSFAVTKDVVAVGTYEGTLELVDLGQKKSTSILDFKKKYPKKNYFCRSLTFSLDGSDKLITAMSEDGFPLVIYDVECGLQEIRRIRGRSEYAVSSLAIINEHNFAVGDDDGGVVVWDLRSKRQVMNAKPGKENVNQMVVSPDGETILCAMLDAKLCTIKIRSGAVFQSEQYENPFNALATYRHNSKLGVGDDVGNLYFFDWGKFGYHSDVYKGHKSPINSMVPITEKIGILGFEDGSIRAFHYFPHKPVGIIGEHPTMIQHMDISSDGRTLVSSSHEDEIRYWDVGFLEDVKIPTDTKQLREEAKLMKKQKQLRSSNKQNSSEFFAGMSTETDETSELN